MRRGSGRAALYLLLTFGAIIMITPFIWMVLTSLKSPAEIGQYPPGWWPQEWLWGNYPAALQVAPFGVYFRNSFVIATSHMAIDVVLASMAGYSLARLRYRGREVVFIGILGLMMLPGYVRLVPQYLMARSVPFFGGNDWLGQGGSGWLDTWWVLIVPGALAPFSIFLFRQFYLALPMELEEAARLDGVSEFGIFVRIMTPLIKPAIATVALLKFQESWNNFLWPLVTTSSTDLRVIQVGLAAFQQAESGHAPQWALLMAAATLATLPMIILFVAAQRYFIQGFSTVGLKG